MKMPPIEPVITTLFNELLIIFTEIFAESSGWKEKESYTYCPWEIFERIIQACVNNTSIEDVCDTYEGCSADRVFGRIYDLDFEQTVHQLNLALHLIVSQFGIHGNQLYNLQIDINDQKCYGSSESELATESKPKNGTNKFNRFVTASLQIGKRSIPIYFRPMRQNDSFSPYCLIKDIFDTLEPKFLIDRIFADGYFSASDVIDFLQTRGIEYIFNMKEYSGVKEVIQSYREEFLLGYSPEERKKIKDTHFYSWLKQNNLIYSDFRFNFDSNPDVEFKVILKAVLYKKGKKGEQMNGKLFFILIVQTLTPRFSIRQLSMQKGGVLKPVTDFLIVLKDSLHHDKLFPGFFSMELECS